MICALKGELNMAIISMSLDEKLLSEIDHVQADLKLSTRSQAIRSGLQLLLQEYKAEASLKGNIHAVLVVIHQTKSEDRVSKSLHDFDDLIKTHVHNHLTDERCLELLVLHGSADKIREMVQTVKQKAKPLATKLLIA